VTAQIAVADISVDVIFKDVKNIHLSVHPPHGDVRIAAPLRANLDSLRIFVAMKLDWIRRQRKKLVNQPRETPREFLPHESHYVWGKRYLLAVERPAGRRGIRLKHSKLVMAIEPEAALEQKRELLAAWYRNQIRAHVTPILDQWQPRLGLSVSRVFVRQMKTKWGSSNPDAQTIRLNTELAKKPLECLEYVVLHEVVHLIEPTHGERFMAAMDRLMPNWRLRRDILNALPISDGRR
jgi:hypothetical protein